MIPRIRPVRQDRSLYLEASGIIDYENGLVKKRAQDLKKDSRNALDLIEKSFLYVRDRIVHTADMDKQKASISEVTNCASEVLGKGHGICYAKSHLLAALLRANGIPAGFCYQRLILDDDKAPYLVLHGLCGVFIESENKWIRLDPRGNKEDVHAEFSINEEKLAFTIRGDMGEEDGFAIFETPDPGVIQALESASDAGALFSNLPKVMKREVWDLYDENRKLLEPLGIRDEQLPDGMYHLVVHIWIRNPQGQYLISKRTANKPFGLMWESTGGSVTMGEDSLMGALREVKEEIGIDLKAENGQMLRSDIRGDNIRDVWIFEQDVVLEAVVFQPEEVCDARLAYPSEILEMIEQGNFIGHFTYLNEVFDWHSEQ